MTDTYETEDSILRLIPFPGCLCQFNRLEATQKDRT